MSCRSRRPRRPRIPRLPGLPVALAVTLAVAGAAGPSAAQYTPPGTTGPTSDIPPGDSLRARYEDARWHVGALALSPWLGLRDGSFVVDSGEGTDAEQDDFTATAGGGLVVLVPTGPKTVWTVEGGLEYSYWNDLDERSRAGGRAGAAVFGFYNRLRLELGGGLEETEQYASAELPQLLPFRTEHARADLTLGVSRKYLIPVLEHFDRIGVTRREGNRRILVGGVS